MLLSSYLVMPVSMVTDTRLKGLKEILPIGLGIWSDEGESPRKRIKLREGKRDNWEETVTRELFCVWKQFHFLFILEWNRNEHVSKGKKKKREDS